MTTGPTALAAAAVVAVTLFGGAAPDDFGAFDRRAPPPHTHTRTHAPSVAALSTTWTADSMAPPPGRARAHTPSVPPATAMAAYPTSTLFKRNLPPLPPHKTHAPSMAEVAIDGAEVVYSTTSAPSIAAPSTTSAPRGALRYPPPHACTHAAARLRSRLRIKAPNLP